MPLLYPYCILHISIQVNILQAPTSALIIPILHPSYLHSSQHIVGSDQCPYYTHIASSISPFTSTYYRLWPVPYYTHIASFISLFTSTDCRLRPVPLLYPYCIVYISIHLNILQAPTSALIIHISHLLYLHSPQHIADSDQCPYYTHIASFISPYTLTCCRFRPVPLLYPYSILHISIHLNILQAPTSALIIPISHLLYLHSPKYVADSDQCPYYTHIASFISPFTSTYCRLRPVPLLYPYRIFYI